MPKQFLIMKIFGRELNEKNFLIEDVKRLLTNVNSPDERLNVLFSYVQKRMNWNKASDYYTDAGLVKAYKDQTGNVAEINFILINMLRLAGLEANPVLISTTENGLPVYPTMTGFNYVIAAVQMTDKQVLLDATNKFTVPDILPLNVLNWKGRLIKDDGTSLEIDLDPIKPSKENFNLMVKIEEDGKMTGQVRIVKTDYDAYRFRIQNSGKTTESYVEAFESQLGNLDITNYRIENLNSNFKNPIVETFSFTSNSQSDIIGEKLFINPLLFFTSTKNPFVSEQRQMSVYFGYKYQERYIINLEIPAGYSVDAMPFPTKIVTEDRFVTYMLDYLQTENKIQINCIKEINNSNFAADYYDGLKDIFQKIISSQNEKIVLKKI